MNCMLRVAGLLARGLSSKRKMARELDDTLWSLLPREILEEYVLQGLPFSRLCRFRAVCKDWNTKLAIHPEKPHLLDIPCNSPREGQLQLCYLYSPMRNIWSHIDLFFVIASMYELGYPSSWKPQVKTYCSDGGLRCVWDEFLAPRGGGASIRHYHVLVCNPITRSCKEIGGRWDGNRYKPRDLAMHKDSSGGYKISAATFDQENKVLLYFMYDSVPQCWKVVCAVQDSQRVDQYVHCSIVFNGVFYSCLKESCDDGKNAGVSLERQAELFASDIGQDYRILTRMWDEAQIRLSLAVLPEEHEEGHLRHEGNHLVPIVVVFFLLNS